MNKRRYALRPSVFSANVLNLLNLIFLKGNKIAEGYFLRKFNYRTSINALSEKKNETLKYFVWPANKTLKRVWIILPVPRPSF